MNATIKTEKKHFPVLLSKLTNIISPLYGGTFIDCTFGVGGYSNEILKDKRNNIIAIDRDISTIEYANLLKKKYGSRFQFKNIKFSQIINLNAKNLKGIIFDLGYSLIQINDNKKGISFNSKSKLNMRMGLNNISAHDVINYMKEENLIKILKYFGNEEKSKFITKKIIQKRQSKEIQTQDLVAIIDSVKKFNKSKIHNSTKTFQAIRIYVNREISELIYGLINSFKILPIGGIIAVVTFHSLEDKIVKFFFKYYSQEINNSRYLPEKEKETKVFKLERVKPILPSSEEINKNQPSRSAKLRYGFKIAHLSNLEEFENQFKFFLEIENLGINL